MKILLLKEKKNNLTSYLSSKMQCDYNTFKIILARLKQYIVNDEVIVLEGMCEAYILVLILLFLQK